MMCHRYVVPLGALLTLGCTQRGVPAPLTIVAPKAFHARVIGSGSVGHDYVRETVLADDGVHGVGTITDWMG